MAEEQEKDDKAPPVGIVVTGTEQFGESQGFIPAAEAEKAGLRVTGVTTEESAADDTSQPATRKAAAKKGARKK